MKFYPIHFSVEMVQASQAGTKTETRRTINPQPVAGNDLFNMEIFCVDGLFWRAEQNEPIIVPPTYKTKYGQPGSCLWVREHYTVLPNGKFAYKADAPGQTPVTKWTVNRFMPKQACRTFLMLNEVRIERLQNITSQSALAEGILEIAPGLYKNYLPGTTPRVFKNPQLSYFSLWQKLMGRETWVHNPWVWVLKFNQISAPQNFLP